MNRTAALAGLALAATFAAALSGCADPAKAPAEAALAAADSALAGLTQEVTRWAPEAAASARTARDAARAAAAKGDWKSALAGAQGVPPAVKAAAEAAAAARLAAQQQDWVKAKQDVSNLLYALEDRLDLIDEKPASAPGLDRSGRAAARAEYQAIQAAWTALSREGGASDLAGDVTKARALDGRIRAVLEKVGLR